MASSQDIFRLYIIKLIYEGKEHPLQVKLKFEPPYARGTGQRIPGRIMPFRMFDELVQQVRECFELPDTTIIIFKGTVPSDGSGTLITLNAINIIKNIIEANPATFTLEVIKFPTWADRLS